VPLGRRGRADDLRPRFRASGSLFPIGTTTVHCTASDNAGNTSAASFTVHVNSAAEQLNLLITAVNGVAPGSALTSKLTQVKGYLAKNDKADACTGLSSFIGLVASQKGKKLTVAQANSFTAQANSIRATLGC
jgi:HYR domain